ncbi:hypothetical protein ACSF6V_11315 [Escherichia coli]|uniref:hypothetical protein n=1 Tax=Escherichia coli TaxID=562 RepID=UPI003EEB8ED1
MDSFTHIGRLFCQPVKKISGSDFSSRHRLSSNSRASHGVTAVALARPMIWGQAMASRQGEGTILTSNSMTVLHSFIKDSTWKQLLKVGSEEAELLTFGSW